MNMDIPTIESLINSISSLKEGDMNERLVSLIRDLTENQIKDRSRDIGELSGALAKAQEAMNIAAMDSSNPFFKSKYADLASIVRASRPALTRNGLAVTHRIVVNDDGSQTMVALLSHSSGQWIESRMRLIPPKNDAQSMGSYITYLRRYTYGCLVGVAASHEDDDGEASMDHDPVQLTKPNINKYRASEVAIECVTKDQLDELEYELKDHPDLAEEVMDKLQIRSLADMPKEIYRASIERIRKIKVESTSKKK